MTATEGDYREQTGWHLLEEIIRRGLSPRSTSRVDLIDELARDDRWRQFLAYGLDEVLDDVARRETSPDTP